MNLQKTRRRRFIPLSHAKWKTAAVGFPDTKKKKKKRKKPLICLFLGETAAGEIASRAHYVQQKKSQIKIDAELPDRKKRSCLCGNRETRRGGLTRRGRSMEARSKSKCQWTGGWLEQQSKLTQKCCYWTELGGKLRFHILKKCTVYYYFFRNMALTHVEKSLWNVARFYNKCFSALI